MPPYRIWLSPAALTDLERLQDFLQQAGDPLAETLLDFVMDAVDVLTHQPGIGRPVDNGLRELIIDRGGSGYLARYHLQREQRRVLVLRLRHQRESGYAPEDI